MNRATAAFGHARVRAWRSRLLTRVTAAPLLAASDASSVARAVAALGVDDPFPRLLHIYAITLRSYPDAVPLLSTLLRRHELENVRLLWRAAVRRHPHAVVRSLWRDFGALSTVQLQEIVTLDDLVARLAPSPYGAIASSIARVHQHDLASAELALDRWMSRQMLNAAQRLPPREHLARRLVEHVVRERDEQLRARGARAYGLATVVAQPVNLAALRSERRRLCHRAFIGSPFTLAPPVALVLLAEEEVRAVSSLVERAGDLRFDAILRDVIAASELAAPRHADGVDRGV